MDCVRSNAGLIQADRARARTINNKVAPLATIRQSGKVGRLPVKRIFNIVGAQCDDEIAYRSDRFGAHARLQVDGEL
jgi:hypothetical protein